MARKSPRSAKSDTVVAKKAKSATRRGRQRTKKQIALSLLERSKGATVAEMQKALGWQAHSVRGFLSSTAKKLPGVDLVSNKTGTGPRRYRTVPNGLDAMS